ncbi:class I SAM-dependent methyltransferase [Streptomyces sp. TRM66268-LWL]|uniref:Class I SAM-dependent methyltransferase n=1 Tax=Streptomyces polyasparticus TaxID=2767826 RepID=A0ABR7SB81_9ACTN|nr:cyclopropane-fatty-acyl-phospholipid synthase family protein [Streptomyces polyasparticus]MBC9712746.1 class I SAM-dependent methyltransferase [Streptomyces polyasparticus]
MTSTAQRLTTLLTEFLGAPPPLRLRTWDGSESGPADAPVLVVHSRRALRRLLWQPGELGLAEAYISGEIDVEGDLADGLRALREAPLSLPRPGPGRLARAALSAARLGALGPRPPAPAGRARLRGTRHTTARDAAAISHHYDLSNDFYALLLDESMAYSCAYWACGDPQYGLAEAQRDKLELICRKLALRPGARLLDIGCGWGALTLYAAAKHTVRVTAVTLARRQYDHVRAAVRERGLESLVDVRLAHYREAPQGPYDAVSCIEMGEHVGDAEYASFAGLLHRVLRPGGRLLLQQMSRGAHAPGGGAFIETYIAPDMHMRPLGQTVGLLEDAGLEVRATESLREHYARTVAAWRDTLEERWDAFVALVGEPTARVWRLYLVGGGQAFEARRMGVDQILAVRPGPDGTSGMPPSLATWYDGMPTSTADSYDGLPPWPSDAHAGTHAAVPPSSIDRRARKGD